MQNLVSLEQVYLKMSEDQISNCERQAILKQLKGFKYWLFLLGL